MKNKKIEHSKPLVDLLHGESTENITNKGMSRRDAMKMMGIGGAAAFMARNCEVHFDDVVITGDEIPELDMVVESSGKLTTSWASLKAPAW